MFCTDIPNPIFLIYNTEVPPLLYYSHIPVIIVSLLLGFFVYFKNRKLLVSKILLGISITFSLWVFLNLVLWTNNDSRLLMFAWSLTGILDALFFLLSLYLIYVFIDRTDISLTKKTVLGLIFLPIVLLAPINYLTSFDTIICEATQNRYFVNYLYTLEAGVSLWIIILAITRYRKADKDFKKQILYLTIGVSLFLLLFFTSGYIAESLDKFEIEFYGLFGMLIFMAFLAYLIVRFKAFNIKLLATQAFVAALVILIGSQFFFNERLIQLVEDLLNVSRIESGRMEFDFQMAQVENLTKEVTDALEIMAKDKSLYLDYRKPNVALPKVKIDSKKIKEVISNLVENAIKYTQRGGVTVRFEAGRRGYGGC